MRVECCGGGARRGKCQLTTRPGGGRATMNFVPLTAHTLPFSLTCLLPTPSPITTLIFLTPPLTNNQPPTRHKIDTKIFFRITQMV